MANKRIDPIDYSCAVDEFLDRLVVSDPDLIGTSYDARLLVLALADQAGMTTEEQVKLARVLGFEVLPSYLKPSRRGCDETANYRSVH